MKRQSTYDFDGFIIVFMDRTLICDFRGARKIRGPSNEKVLNQKVFMLFYKIFADHIKSVICYRSILFKKQSEEKTYNNTTVFFSLRRANILQTVLYLFLNLMALSQVSGFQSNPDPLSFGMEGPGSAIKDENSELSFADLDPVYRPVIYAQNNIIDFPCHFYLTYNIPPLENLKFLNVKFTNLLGNEFWGIENLPLPKYTFPLPARYMTIEGSATWLCEIHSPSLTAEWAITDEEITDPLWIGQGTMSLLGVPVDYRLGNGASIGEHRLISVDPIVPFSYLPFPQVKALLRGCEVPNIDLDSTAYPKVPGQFPSTSDDLACGPAAAANSLRWLSDQFEEIDLSTESDRAILDTLKRMMKLDTVGGVTYINFVKGKLEFIDKHKLPIRVKFQSHASADSIVSPNPTYGSHAKNHSPKPRGHITYDWLKNELEEDEDVELSYGYFCDTIVKDTVIIDGQTIIKDTLKRVRKGGHYVNVTGYIQVGNRKFITFKHDPIQSGPGGTTDENGQPITDFSEWAQDTNGYQILLTKSTPQCRAYIETVVSESYDPQVKFCTKTVIIPEDYGDGSLRHAISCAESGDIIYNVLSY